MAGVRTMIHGEVEVAAATATIGVLPRQMHGTVEAAAAAGVLPRQMHGAVEAAAAAGVLPRQMHGEEVAPSNGAEIWILRSRQQLHQRCPLPSLLFGRHPRTITAHLQLPSLSKLAAPVVRESVQRNSQFGSKHSRQHCLSVVLQAASTHIPTEAEEELDLDLNTEVDLNTELHLNTELQLKTDTEEVDTRISPTEEEVGTKLRL